MSNWIEVAAVADFELSDRKYCEVEDEAIGIFKVDDGNYYAISAICSHQRVSMMAGDVDGCIITCPLHGAEFDLRDGSHLCMPAVRPVASYPLKIEDDKIFIDFTED